MASGGLPQPRLAFQEGITGEQRSDRPEQHPHRAVEIDRLPGKGERRPADRRARRRWTTPATPLARPALPPERWRREGGLDEQVGKALAGAGPVVGQAYRGSALLPTEVLVVPGAGIVNHLKVGEGVGAGEGRGDLLFRLPTQVVALLYALRPGNSTCNNTIRRELATRLRWAWKNLLLLIRLGVNLQARGGFMQQLPADPSRMRVSAAAVQCAAGSTTKNSGEVMKSGSEIRATVLAAGFDQGGLLNPHMLAGRGSICEEPGQRAPGA